MKILAIDTSCDETSVAVTEGFKVLSNTVSSQVNEHKEFGGVVPFLAQRLHQERIDAVVQISLEEADVRMKDVEAIAVTYGPGLAPALQVGVAKAKELSTEYDLPLYAINHMAGHIASCYANEQVSPIYPTMTLLLSGNHTELVVMSSFGDFQIIGQTLDDALGEAYDKVARMLGLGYPGGKLVADYAQKGDATIYELPVPMINSGDLNFSYSGLKNAVRLLVEKVKETGLGEEEIANISAAFERVAQESIIRKLIKALAMFPECKALVLGGGVAANTVLRERLQKLCKETDLVFQMPTDFKLCTDNAAMIGVAAYMGIENGQMPADVAILDRIPYLSLEDYQVYLERFLS